MTELGNKQVLKGLVKPQFESKTPLNLLFNQLSEVLDLEDNGDVINTLYGRIDDLPKNESIGDGLLDVSKIQIRGSEGEILDSFERRYFVLDWLLSRLIQIKIYSEEAKAKQNNKDVLMISLHDMKTFGSLVNTIVLQGVYSAIPDGVGITLEKRRMNEFKKNRKSFKPLKIEKIANKKQQFSLLGLIINRFLVIFDDAANDVKDLLLKGVGYSDFLISALYVIYNPYIVDRPGSWPEVFEKIEGFSNTFELYELYSLLINGSTNWFKQLCLDKVSHLPFKRHVSGVISLIEYATGMRYNEQISIEKFDHVNRILLNKPKDIATVRYFDNISKQTYNIMILINRPVLTSVCVNFIEALYERNHRIVVDFFFKKIWDRCCPASLPENQGTVANKHSHILVNGKDYNNVVNVVFTMVKNTNKVAIVACLFAKDLVLSLWNYLIFVKENKLSKSTDIVIQIFKLYFTTNPDCQALEVILDNIMIGTSNFPWQFSLEYVSEEDVVTQEIAIVYELYETKALKPLSKEQLFNRINVATDNFIDLLEQLDNDGLIQKFFILILRKWLVKGPEKLSSLEDDETARSYQMLSVLRVLQTFSVKFKDQLNNNENMYEILDILDSVLEGFSTEKEEEADSDDEKEKEADSDDEQENDEKENDEHNRTIIDVFLELFWSILSDNHSFKLIDSAIIDKLDRIYDQLVKTSHNNEHASSLTRLKNEILAIRKTNDKFLSKDSSLSKKETLIKLHRVQQQYETDLKTYNQAIKLLNDPIVPIRAHGLQLVNELVKRKSKILSLEDVIQLYLGQLKHEDPFIYLNAIRNMTVLIESNLSQSLPVLLNLFEDQNLDMDTKLKIGEVLNNLVLKYERNPSYSTRHSSLAFPASLTDQLASKMIRLVRVTSLTDNAIRLSSLAILQSCFQAHLNGIARFLQDTLDLALGILTFELKDTQDQVSMRRGAIKLIYGIITSPIALNEFPKGYGRKILAALAHTKDHDIDLLTRDQAQDTLQQIKDMFKQSILGDV